MYSDQYKAATPAHIKVLIANLRNRREAEENWKSFEVIVQANLSWIVDDFSSRWLVSICDTYADYGSQTSRRNALLISLFINMMRLSDSLYEDKDIRLERIQQIKTGWPPFYSEMHALHIDQQDTLLNLMKRLTRALQDDDVLHPIFLALLRRAKANDNLLQRFMKHSANPDWVFPENALEIADQYGVK
ncbi:hypothetical protein DW352_03550 [Pseudolabrys taiwanensis]|uniref:Uncharacterized protein n=1 Tax=Pseudolabrys taiwanensis TaxID=331696 RepID=A0A345ZRX6_9HYPH|nr:hypothetical protein [Pseudolabrys taiwanensis]AXK79673.1 hypothetical protein DW352_03550 [Pseudolabrys taiwanensis]